MSCCVFFRLSKIIQRKIHEILILFHCLSTRKVQFDTGLHFAHHGCGNMETMRNDHFKLEFNEKSEAWFLIKNKDELTKNLRVTDNLVSGIMPENKTDRLCSICSYRIYLQHI